MMIRDTVVVEAVVSLDLESSAFRIVACGAEEGRTSSLVRLDRPPASGTDVIEASGEFVSRTGLFCSRWELRRERDDALLAAGALPPTRVRPFVPVPYVVRLYGSGAAA